MTEYMKRLLAAARDTDFRLSCILTDINKLIEETKNKSAFLDHYVGGVLADECKSTLAMLKDLQSSIFASNFLAAEIDRIKAETAKAETAETLESIS